MKKIIEIIRNKEILKKILMIFLITYPIFDITFFYNSYTTLFRIFIISLIFILVVSLEKIDKRQLKFFLVYAFAILIYFICQQINAINFKSLVPGNFNYSIINEIEQLIKLCMPILLVYILKYIKFNTKEIILIIKSWIIIICGSIIITNLFEISMSSYSSEIIKGNIFDWFSSKYIYSELASIGYFKYANQITAILICVLPILYYFVIEGKLKIFYLIMTMLTLLLLGTRISNIGGILVLVVLVCLSLFFKLFKKQRLEKGIIFKCLLIILVYMMFLPFSPTASRSQIYNLIGNNERKLYALEENNKSFDEINSIDNTIINQKKEFIEKNYLEYKINPNFILNSYPYQYDVEFWYNIMQLEESKRIDYRFLETEMVRRVVEINDNKLDILFGITNTRVKNIFNIERDFILQYYSYGIVGSILILGIYFIILTKKIIKVKKNCSFFNIISLSVIVLFLLICLMSRKYIKPNIDTDYDHINIINGKFTQKGKNIQN